MCHVRNDIVSNFDDRRDLRLKIININKALPMIFIY
jgi:hypothetical protein